MVIYLGVDGGGTKTEFVAIGADGAVLTRARRGTTYHLQTGVEAAINQLEGGVGAVCAMLATDRERIAFAFFGLPVYGEDAAIDPMLDAACGRILGHNRYRVGNDMICGWAGSLGCEDGINIVAGTGSIGYGERGGRSARAGGWGELIGDEGSAYWIALRGLSAFTRMSDGREPRGPLIEIIRRELVVTRDIDVLARIMGPPPMTRDAVAALAPAVVEAAAAGDPSASDILDEAARELAALAFALRSQLRYPPDERAAVSWSGGVLERNATVRNGFERALANTGNYALITPRYDPGHGAALYARKLAAEQAKTSGAG